MIAKLEWTQSNAQQNIEQLQYGRNNNNEKRINNNRTTALEQTAAKATRGLKCILLVPDFAVGETQKMLSSHRGFLNIATIEKQYNQINAIW